MGNVPLSPIRGAGAGVGRPQTTSWRQAEEGAGAGGGDYWGARVGKSRLCYEFTRAHHTHGWLNLETSADRYGQATPYLPVIDLLKSYFQLDAAR